MVITQDAVAREDANARKKEMVRVAGDYDGYVDVLPRDVALADMKAKGYPERTCQLFAEIYCNMQCRIRTMYGLSVGVKRGNRGVGQGAISSPLVSFACTGCRNSYY